MYCTKCGTLINEQSDKCKNCGEYRGDIVAKKKKELEHFAEDKKRAVKK